MTLELELVRKVYAKDPDTFRDGDRIVLEIGCYVEWGFHSRKRANLCLRAIEMNKVLLSSFQDLLLVLNFRHKLYSALFHLCGGHVHTTRVMCVIRDIIRIQTMLFDNNKSLICRMNCVGDITEPLGMPALMGMAFEHEPSIKTCMLRPERKLAIHMYRPSGSP